MLRLSAAVLVAIAVFFDPSIAPSSTGPANTNGLQQVGKADRLDIRSLIGPACSQTVWPYYESACLRDRRSGLQPRTVRVIPIHRPSRERVTIASVN